MQWAYLFLFGRNPFSAFFSSVVWAAVLGAFVSNGGAFKNICCHNKIIQQIIVLWVTSKIKQWWLKFNMRSASSRRASTYYISPTRAGSCLEEFENTWCVVLTQWSPAPRWIGATMNFFWVSLTLVKSRYSRTPIIWINWH